jgi:glycosyltransferase 2 family protein
MHGAMPGDLTDPAPNAAIQRQSVVGRLWRRWGWVVRWTGTVLGALYVSTLIHPSDLRDAFSRVSIAVVVSSASLIGLGQLIGAVRWRITLAAYGASARPALATAIRLYLVAVFYNSYLPGAVAGDVVRAVVTRDCFADHGTTGALAVVFVERALGLFAVFALVITGVALSGDALGIQGSLRFWSLGALSLTAVIALALGRRLAPFLPRPLARIAQRLPSVVRPRAFATAAVLSLGTQGTTVIAGWLILGALHPGVTLADALVIIPTAAATAFLPITVGGTGAREAVFVLLGGKLLGMSSNDAVAASLLLWMSILLIGAIGGALLLLGRGGAPTIAKPAAG